MSSDVFAVTPRHTPRGSATVRISTGKIPCDACGSDRLERKMVEVDGILMMLCTDFLTCCLVYREGRTPTSYMQLLKVIPI